MIYRVPPNSEKIIDHMERCLLYSETSFAVDVSNASPYHASKITARGIRWGYEVCCQYDGYKKTVSEVRNHYELTSPDEKTILGIMNLEAQSFKDIESNYEVNGNIGRSNIYNALTRMIDRGLIERGGVEPPEGYKGKTLHGFKLSKEQYLDYRAYKKRDDEQRNLVERIKANKMKEKRRRQGL